MPEKKIVYSVEIEGNEATLQEIAKLREETERLKRENKEYNRALKSGETVSKEQARNFERNTIQIKENTSSMRRLTKEIQANGGQTENARRRLTKMRQELQEMAIAGDTSSEAYRRLRGEAAQLQDGIDRVSNEIKVFADDALVINTVVDSTRALTAGFQGVMGVQALLGFESEKFQETMQKLVAIQQVSNSLQTVSNLLQKESRLIILGKAAAVKAATAAQWLWNVAMTANPIGLIIAGVAALGAAVYGLVKHFDAVTNAIKRAADWLVFWKDLGYAAQDASDSVASAAEETARVRSEIRKLRGETEDYVAQLEYELEIMRIRGAEQIEMYRRERAILELRIRSLKEQQTSNRQLIMQLQYLSQVADEDIKKNEEWIELKKEQEEIEKELNDLQRESGLLRERILVEAIDHYRRRIESVWDVFDAEKKAELERKALMEDSLDARLALLKHETDQRIEELQRQRQALIEEVEEERKDHFEAGLDTDFIDMRLNQLRNANQEELLIRAEYQKEAEKLIEEHQEKIKEERQAHVNELYDTLKGSFEERNELITTWYEDQTIGFREFQMLQDKIHEDYQVKRQQRDELFAEMRSDEIERRHFEEREKLKRLYEANLLTHEEYYNRLNLLDEEIGEEKRLREIDQWYDEQHAKLKQHLDNKIISQMQYNILLDELNERRRQKQKEEELEEFEEERMRYLEHLRNITNDEQSEFQQRREMYQQWLNDKVISTEEYNERIKQLDQDLSDFRANVALAEAQAMATAYRTMTTGLSQLMANQEESSTFLKALAIVDAGVALTMGLIQSAKAGFPQNIPLMIGYAAQTAGLMNQIKSQNVPSAPKFKDGGMIGGKSHSNGGTVFTGDDGSIFEAEKDEYLAIVNKRDSRRAAMLDSINSEHGESFGKGGIFHTTIKKFRRGGIFEPRTDFERNDMENIITQTVERISNIPVVVSERDITGTQDKVRKVKVKGNLSP